MEGGEGRGQDVHCGKVADSAKAMPQTGSQLAAPILRFTFLVPCAPLFTIKKDTEYLQIK